MTLAETPALFHYCCAHSREGILHDGLLLPNPQPFLPGAPPLVWLTDLDAPIRDGLGLTSDHIKCDRTEYRFSVIQTGTAVWWPTYARMTRVPRATRDVLESFGMPAHWYVSSAPVPVVEATS